ncbi:MAG: hypothetical protein FWD63_05430 [Propionibacteriaceae bacterium]|nr:hypothetical protein [Propionibacteriaceae bacterium]
MGFLALRELRGSTARIDQILERDGSVIVTNNGKPAYVMLDVDETNFEDTIIDLRRVRAKRAVARMQRTSAKLGTDALTADDINAEIAAERAARK